MKAPRPRHPDSEPGYLGELQFTPKPPAESAASPLPLWFLLLPLLAVLPWWPIDPFWQSDDFLAIHYAQNLQRALHDLIGWQYGATDLLLFFRPLITLSFWVDVQLAGSAPFWSHLSNVLAHGGSTLLVGLLWTRLLTPGRAFTAALLWAIAPGHVGAISWAVGRVDAHTALWCLACLWLLLRWCEGRQRTRLPSLLALAAALLSKELAFAVPPIALVLAAAASLEPGLAARARAGLRASWPHWLLFAIYLGYRWLVLGGFGGYLSARYDLVPSLLGFATIVRNLLAPLWWCGEAVLVELCGSAPVWVRWLALLPAVVALAYWLRPQRVRAFVTVLAVFLLACAPMVAFCADPGNHHNLRYFYLPSAALAGLLVAPSRLLSLLLLLGAAIPLVEVRQLQLRADRETAAMHLELLHAVMNGAQSPLFVAGLPHSNPSGTAIQMHLFVDRMLEPPFGPGGVRLLPLRPAGRVADAFLLTEGGELPFALPAGTTLWFDGPAVLVTAPPQPLPELPVTATDPVDLTTPSFEQLLQKTRVTTLRMPGVRTPALRLTIFTALGYLSAVVRNHARSGSDGELDLLRFFGGDKAIGKPAGAGEPEVEAARYAESGDTYVLTAMELPTILDLLPEFPVLLEGGQLAGKQFVPTHRARRLLTFRFDRGFPAFVRRALGIAR